MKKIVHCLSTGRTTHRRRGRQRKSNEIFQCPQRLQSQSAERLWMWRLVKALPEANTPFGRNLETLYNTVTSSYCTTRNEHAMACTTRVNTFVRRSVPISPHAKAAQTWNFSGLLKVFSYHVHCFVVKLGASGS